jgi:hypothetical protein
MNARWKWIAVIAVVVMVSVIRWSALADPERGITIQFVGYNTNQLKWDAGIEARFCLTNGSAHTIFCRTFHDKLLVGTEIVTNRERILTTYSQPTDGSPDLVLAPGQRSFFSVPTSDVTQRLRVIVPYRTNGVWPSGGYTMATNNAPGANFTSFNNVLISSRRTVATPFSLKGFKQRVKEWLLRKPAETSVSLTIQD